MTTNNMTNEGLSCLHEYYAAENYYLKQLFLLHDVIDEMQNVIDLWHRKALEQELQIRDLRKLN